MRPARVSPLYTLTCSHTLFSRRQGQVVENEHKLNIMYQFYIRHKSVVDNKWWIGRALEVDADGVNLEVFKENDPSKTYSLNSQSNEQCCHF